MDNHSSVSLLRMFASYHDWANALLSTHIATIKEDDYTAPAGLFFGSIHGTLNHVLVSDRSWHARFVSGPASFDTLLNEPGADRRAVLEGLHGQQGVWQKLLAETSPETMEGSLVYKTKAGELATTPWVGTLVHVFNHATHHRGQISAALTALNYDCPELDLIYFLRRTA